MEQIAADIFNVGVNSHHSELFEAQYPVPNGMSYNSYVILDGKVAVMDTADVQVTREWLDNVEEVLKGRQPDYLIIQHMEPDHSASIAVLAGKYPDVTVVGNARTFSMLRQFYPEVQMANTLCVSDGDTLPLGRHTLRFLFAPMVHWPEVMMTYETSERLLFSADAFGRFGASDAEDDWVGEARRYYFGIVGKYGVQVQNVLKKAAALDIRAICPLHGPVLTEDLGYYLKLYDTWSAYRPEQEGVCICYASIYGHTEKAVKLLETLLGENGVKVVSFDLTRCDISQAIAAAFCYDRLVLASVTYNGDVFPHMRTFLAALEERGFRNRKVAFVENGSWAPLANKVMRAAVQNWKEIDACQYSVTIRSAMNDEAKAQIRELSRELRQSVCQ